MRISAVPITVLGILNIVNGAPTRAENSTVFSFQSHCTDIPANDESSLQYYKVNIKSELTTALEAKGFVYSLLPPEVANMFDWNSSSTTRGQSAAGIWSSYMNNPASFREPHVSLKIDEGAGFASKDMLFNYTSTGKNEQICFVTKILSDTDNPIEFTVERRDTAYIITQFVSGIILNQKLHGHIQVLVLYVAAIGFILKYLPDGTDNRFYKQALVGHARGTVKEVITIAILASLQSNDYDIERLLSTISTAFTFVLGYALVRDPGIRMGFKALFVSPFRELKESVTRASRLPCWRSWAECIRDISFFVLFASFVGFGCLSVSKKCLEILFVKWLNPVSEICLLIVMIAIFVSYPHHTTIDGRDVTVHGMDKAILGGSVYLPMLLTSIKNFVLIAHQDQAKLAIAGFAFVEFNEQKLMKLGRFLLGNWFVLAVADYSLIFTVISIGYIFTWPCCLPHIGLQSSVQLSEQAEGS